LQSVIAGFPRFLESPGFFSLKFQDLESPRKISLTEISRISSTKFGQLILSKILIKLLPPDVILRLKCTKFDFGWGSTPDPALGELTALPQTP